MISAKCTNKSASTTKLSRNSPKSSSSIPSASAAFAPKAARKSKAATRKPASDDLTHAQTLANELGNEEEKAKILQAMGVAYSDLGKLDEALHSFQDSLEIKRSSD